MLDEYLSHLRKSFSPLGYINIRLALQKSFLGFPSVQLLGQTVDGLRLDHQAKPLGTKDPQSET